MKVGLIILLLFPFLLYGQDLYHYTLNADNGLPSNRVHEIFQDSKGYLWLGTENGVCRWDSKNFLTYTIKDGLPNNEVLVVYEDSKGRIWFSTFSNELCYLQNDTIFNAKNDKRLKDIHIVKGGKLFEDKGNMYYCDGKSGNVFYFDVNTLITLYSGLKAVSSNPYIERIGERIVLIGVDDKLRHSFFWYRDTMYNFSSCIITKDKSIDYQCIDYNSCIYFHIHCKDLPTFLRKYCRTPLSYDDVLAMESIYGVKTISSNWFDAKMFKPKNIIVDSLQSFKGNLRLVHRIWGKQIEAYSNYIGVNNKFNLTLKYPLNYSRELKDKLAIITENDMALLCHTNILNYNTSNRINKSIHSLVKLNKKIYDVCEHEGLYNMNYTEFIPIRDKSKYYGIGVGESGHQILTLSNGIYNLNTKEELTDKFEESFKFFKGFSYSKKHNLYTLNNGQFGLYIQDHHKKVSKISDRHAYTSFIDSKDRLWTGTVNKLYVTNHFLPRVENEREYVLNKKFDVFTSEIKEDTKGNIFFTTNDGVYILDKSDRKYHLSDKNLLTSNECKTLKLDTAQSSFFVATRSGINHIKYHTVDNQLVFKVVNKFFKVDGLQSNEINDILIDGDSLWVATSKGLDLIVDKNWQPDTIDIKIHINQLFVNGEKINSLQFPWLHHTQNSLQIDFASIYYQRTNRMKIIYRLISDGDTVRQEIKDRTILLQSLAPNDYRLQIYAYDQDYPYIRSNLKELQFTITPPFYKTWWFFGLILATIMSILAIIYRINLNRLKEQHQFETQKLSLEKDLSKFKLEALKAEMNPHFIFNCLNSIKDFILKNESEKSQYYLSQLSKLIRIALYNTKEEFISLRSELEFIDLYVELEQLRFNHQFDYEKKIENLDLLNAEIPMMVLQPFFENAIRHGKIGQLDGRRGKLLLEVVEENDCIIFRIKDNGIGITESQKIKSQTNTSHKSMALDIIKERILIYNQSYNLNMELSIRNIDNDIYRTEVELKYILD